MRSICRRTRKIKYVFLQKFWLSEYLHFIVYWVIKDELPRQFTISHCDLSSIEDQFLFASYADIESIYRRCEFPANFPTPYTHQSQPKSWSRSRIEGEILAFRHQEIWAERDCMIVLTLSKNKLKKILGDRGFNFLTAMYPTLHST